MSRTLHANVTTELQTRSWRPALLAFFDFSSGAVRVWSGTRTLSWSGDSYDGLGTFGGVSLIEETTELRATGATFTLTGFDVSLLTLATDDDYQGRECTLWLGMLDDNDALIGDPVKIFSGRMDVMAKSAQGTEAQITLTGESVLIDLTRPLEVRTYTDQDQQREYPGDRFFEFVEVMRNAVIVWGRTKFEPGASSTPAPPPEESPNEFNDPIDPGI